MVLLWMDTQCSGGCMVSYVNHLDMKSLNFCMTFYVFPIYDREKLHNMDFLETEFVVKILKQK